MFDVRKFIDRQRRNSGRISTNFVSIMVNTTGDESSSEAEHAKPLGRLSILSYGSGHMLNDITSACWFTYLLLFLTDIGLSPRDAAVVMLSGQTADAFTTIFAGELIDRFGHFKLWHAGGSILVAISFSSVFGGCVPCKVLRTDSSVLETVGYSTFAAIFNVGWAVTQVSHMSMVNCITLNPTSRVALASCRNAFTMIANLSLYAIALAVFSAYNTMQSISIVIQYRWIAYLSIFIGCCFVCVFLLGTKEPELKKQIQCKNLSRISWAHWFKKVLYYQVAVVYMLTRLVTNVSQETRWTSLRLKTFFTAGAILWVVSGAGIFVLPSKLHDIMYVLSIIIGVANALMTVTGISMESILVGEDLNGCAFVYGSLSFLDKLSCGLALYALESYQDAAGRTDMKLNNSMEVTHSVTRYGFGVFPAACALVSAVVTYTMDLPDTRSRPLNEPLLA
ncbi:major facilitator superfamily domain-containing protein 12-like isoform X3 [Ananas comosus]|uniref:Major facilitator superfamily domain-containing protein 12-like isoform X3 n=1 Tax=Ananas comosus TaxID=4615 RepID=A0A6P5FEZ4_ANACO|nr:major facilitator superfamily domain-containing protein 12-like isoform X3 [Ananas comosus]